MLGCVSKRALQNRKTGPFGLLVKVVAIKPEDVGSVEYLETPEIIQDICNSFCEMFGENLLTLFKQSSCPCIVTFTDSGARLNALHKAIYYLYVKYRDEDLVLCNTCFDGEGKAISKEQIVRVEHL